MGQSIEIWRACGMGFFVCLGAFAVGLVIGKEIGWRQARDLFAPRRPREK